MIKLYFKYASMLVKTQMEYKKAFILSVIAQIITSFFSVISIYFLFNKFGNIKGYSFEDVLICYIVSFFGYAITECLFRGFDDFDRLLSNGKFDRMLITPRPLLLQVLGSQLKLSKIGRMLLATITLIILLIIRPDLLMIDKFITIILMIIGTIILYAGLFILKAGICFFTTQSLEIMNIFTDGTRDLAQYPLDIYADPIIKFFTFVIPITMVNLYPLQYIIGRTDNKLYIIAPLVTIIMMIPCLLVWKIGVRKYQSIGS